MTAKQYIILAMTIALAASGTFNYFVVRQNNKLNKQITELVKTNAQLAAKETRAYTISLSPNITNKVTTTFGSAKEIENKFYFTMRDISMELNPDSVKTFKK